MTIYIQGVYKYKTRDFTAICLTRISMKSDKKTNQSDVNKYSNYTNLTQQKKNTNLV